MGLNRREFLTSSLIFSFPLISFVPDEPAKGESKRLIFNPSKKGKFTLKKMQTDLLVAGGGMAGVCAALAAARNGARVILVQDRSRLGGNASSEIRMHIVGANSPEKLRLWRETGIIEELKLTEAATNPQHSFEVWDLILYDKVVSEKNITLLLDTAVIDAQVEQGKVTQVTAISPLLEEWYRIEAPYFVDATGDAKLAAVSGARTMRGREGRAVFGESLAPPKSDLKTMGSSILFSAREFDRPMPFRAPAWARKFTAADFAHRHIQSWEFGYWWLEWGGELDTIKDNRKIRHELLRIVLGVWDYIKNSGQFPASENWALVWTGMIPGKRESRRIVGDHVLIQPELERAERYPDRVAYGGWPMDDHPPGGIDSRGEQPARQIFFAQPYHIPLRSLYSTNRPNLMMAGRDISASHVAFSSTRVMATCSAMGQAVGTAAAFCKKHRCLPRDIVQAPDLLHRFQQQLLRDDQAVLDIRNEDEADLARRATATASRETADGAAANVIDGVNRDIGDGGTHQWRAPLTPTAPWIQLQWERPQKIGMLQITFDSGLARRLFLTGEVRHRKYQIRGPQPETVADYRVEAESGGRFQTVATVTGNFLRLRQHSFASLKTRAIRIHVLRTNGDPLARIFEIRCYSEA